MIFIETSAFTRKVKELIPDQSYHELQVQLVANQEKYRYVSGNGGFYKLRWRSSGRGKGGGLSVIYQWLKSEDKIFFIYMYRENEQENPTTDQILQLKRVIKDGIREKALFEELLNSLKEAKTIMDGEKEFSRTIVYDDVDVTSIHEQFGLSQPKFASLLGISADTLKN